MARKTLEGVGYTALGVGFLFQAAKAFGIFGLGETATVFSGNLKGARQLRGLAGPEADAMLRAPKVISSVKTRTVGDIKERVAYIQEQIRKDSAKPEIREKALAVLTRKCDDNTRWCLPAGTLVYRHPGEFVPVERIQPGDTIMGDGAWTRVRATFDRGVQPVKAFTLNNGSVLRCTDEHTLFVVPRRKHAHGTPTPGRRGDEIEVRAADVKVGDDLLQPKSLPYGGRHLDADEALIMGVYISEGWLEPSRVSIAGVPGGKGVREAVIAAAERLGIRFSTDEHKVRLMDPLLVARMEACGVGAANKRVPSLDLDATAVAALLRGIEADARVPARARRATVKTPTFYTTSPHLALQYRVLQRMLGRSTSMGVEVPSRQNHAPVYVVHVRDPQATRGAKPWARVKNIDREPAAQTFDLETESRRIYLPESDVVVHNCVPEKDWEAEIRALFTAVRDAASPMALRYTRDHAEIDQFHSADKLLKLKGGDCDDGTILLGSMLRAVGYPIRLRVIQDTGSSTWSHIYLLVGLPPMAPEKWVALDWSVPGKPAGWEAPGAKEVALSGRPSGVVTRLIDFKV
jgi:hypothetical protein